MNFVERNLGMPRLMGASRSSDGLQPSRKWPISYQSIEFVAVLFDAAIILVAGILSGVVYHLATIGTSGDAMQHAASSAVVAALFIALAKSRDLYDPTELMALKNLIHNLAAIWAAVFLFLASVAFALKIGADFSRGAIVLFAAVGLGALVLQRFFWRHLLTRGLARQKFAGRDIVLITDEAAPAPPGLVYLLATHGYQLRDHFVLPAQRHDLRRRQEMISKIIGSLRGSDIQEVVVSTELDHWPELRSLLSALRVLPLPVNLIPAGGSAELLKRPWHMIGETVCIELQRGPLGTFERAAKRTVDILCTLIALVALLPLLTVTAVAIKLDSPGPILFRQRRCGFNGKPFQIRKFRTMSVLEDGEQVAQAARSDSRVTRLGRWLRRTSIDELPQLLNVLEGSMSLVGPRPHAVAHDNHFDKVVRNYAFRHHVKPGLTGWAQVNGYRGATPTVPDIQRRVELDLWYVDHWSLGLDCLILVRTIIEVISGRNAY